MSRLAASVVLLLPCLAAAETHHLKPTTGHQAFAVRPPILTVRAGDRLESESLWGDWYERAGGKWPGEVGPIAIAGAEPGGVAGSARPLSDALRIAFVELIAWLEADYGFGRADAYQLVSQVAEVRVANMVDPLYTVVAKFPKRFLPAKAPEPARGER